MLNSELDSVSMHFPLGFARDWDAHIYYEPSQRAWAQDLRRQALEFFKDQSVFIGALRDELVGPHPLPMFELNFASRDFQVVVRWLMVQRRGLDILVHQVTGDDPRDHYDGALWLGQTLVLDDSKLDPSPPNVGC
jgi:aromatic ring-cleaving dioxygenase